LNQEKIMLDNPEHDGGKSSVNKETDVSAKPSKADLVRLKLKLISSYVIDGFAPFVAVIALIVAMVAVNGNKSGQAQLSQSAAKIDSMAAKVDSMSAILLASRAELEKLKAAKAQENALQQEENKKQDERLTPVIQSISKLQVKMKISPTLEEQLHQPASAAAATPFAASAVSVPAAAVAVPAKADVATGADKKPGAQVQILKEAINKFNKK
jgi:DNA-binding protein H-NS